MVVRRTVELTKVSLSNFQARPPSHGSGPSAAAVRGQAASVPTRTLRMNSVADLGGGQQQSRGVGENLWGHFEKKAHCAKLLDLAKQCGDSVIL